MADLGRSRRGRGVRVGAGVLAAVVALVAGGLIAHDGRDGTARPAEALPAVARVDSSNQAGWWTPIVEHDGAVYYAYDAPGRRPRTHTVVVTRRSPSGETESGCLRRAGAGAGGACTQFPDDVGHHQPSLAVDGAGYVHAFVAMHSSPWRGHYFRSDAPESVARFTDRGAQMPDQGWTHTYPVPAVAPDGDVWLTTRGRSSAEARGVGGRLYRYDVATATWSRVATFAYQPGLWVYTDDVQVDAAGRVHIAFEWVKKYSRTFPHVGAYVTYDPATGRFANVAGQDLPGPLDADSPAAYQPWSASYDPATEVAGLGVQTAKLALDPTAGPQIVYRYMPRHGGRLRVLHAWWDGSQWRRTTVYAGRYDTHPTVDVTLVGASLRVYYAKVDTSGGPTAFVAERRPAGGYAERSLAPGRPGIERLSAITRPGGADLVYLSAPRLFGAEGADGGELYLATVPR